MLLLLPLIRWLGRHDRAWVVISVGILLFIVGVGGAAAGVASHQAIVTHVGFWVLILAIIYAVVAIRARRSQRHDQIPSGDQTHIHGRRDSR